MSPDSIRVQLDDRDHAVFYGFMGWITEWRRRRVLEKHSIDAALWRRATRALPFLPQNQKLKDLVLLFLAEKQFAGVHGVEVTDETEQIAFDQARACEGCRIDGSGQTVAGAAGFDECLRPGAV